MANNKPHTAETRRAISEKMKGRKKSAEHRMAISESMRKVKTNDLVAGVLGLGWEYRVVGGSHVFEAPHVWPKGGVKEPVEGLKTRIVIQDGEVSMEAPIQGSAMRSTRQSMRCKDFQGALKAGLQLSQLYVPDEYLQRDAEGPEDVEG